jgi:hypothetical protein
MAGIAAIVNLDGAPVDGDRVRALVNVPPYRASATCVWAAGPVGLAWTPLRPDAPEREPAQPHSLAVAGGRAWAVFDGRLDDRASLVAALTPATGRALSGASDVELLRGDRRAARGCSATSRPASGTTSRGRWWRCATRSG